MAPSSSAIINLLKVWTQSGQEAERMMQKWLEGGIDMIRLDGHRLFNRVTKGRDITNVVLEWMEAVAYQTRFTATLTSSTLVLSGYLMQEAISASLMRQIISPSLIVERESDGMQLMISSTSTDTDYTTYTCSSCSAWGNSTLSNDSTAVTYKVIGSALSDYDSNRTPKGLTRKFRRVGHQRYKEDFDFPWTKKSIAMEGIANEFEYQMKELQKLIYLKQGNMVLFSRPPYSGGSYVTGLESETPTMYGLFFWPELLYSEYPNANTYVNKSSAEIEANDIDKVIRSMYVDEGAEIGGKGTDFIIACHPVQKTYINEFAADKRLWTMTDKKYGYQVETFVTSDGANLPIVVDKTVPPNKIWIGDPSAFSYHNIKENKLQRVKLGQGEECVDQYFITGLIAGTMCRSPRQNCAMIYGLPTTAFGD